MKKAISITLVLVMCIMLLASCSGAKYSDPIEFAKTLEQQGYDVNITVNKTDMSQVCTEFDIDTDDVECIIAASPSKDSDTYKRGYFFFCADLFAAKEVEKLLNEYAEDSIIFDYIPQGTVERDNEVVFFGSEKCWNEYQ